MKNLLKYSLLTSLLSVSVVAVAMFDMQQPTRQLLAQAEHLEKDALEKALVAFNNAFDAGITDNKIVTIIDYSHPSTKERLWVFDLEQNKLLYEELVSHGRGSGELYAKQFSNKPSSYQSSIGLFITEETYHGRNGYSLRLEGLEDNINHLARERAIVIHGASYVDPSFVAKTGRLGRSHGCPAVNPAVNKELINTIKDGSLVFIYYPDQNYLAKSEFLQADNAENIKVSQL